MVEETFKEKMARRRKELLEAEEKKKLSKDTSEWGGDPTDVKHNDIVDVDKLKKLERALDMERRLDSGQDNKRLVKIEMKISKVKKRIKKLEDNKEGEAEAGLDPLSSMGDALSRLARTAGSPASARDSLSDGLSALGKDVTGRVDETFDPDDIIAEYGGIGQPEDKKVKGKIRKTERLDKKIQGKMKPFRKASKYGRKKRFVDRTFDQKKYNEERKHGLTYYQKRLDKWDNVQKMTSGKLGEALYKGFIQPGMMNQTGFYPFKDMRNIISQMQGYFTPSLLDPQWAKGESLSELIWFPRIAIESVDELYLTIRVVDKDFIQIYISPEDFHDIVSEYIYDPLDAEMKRMLEDDDCVIPRDTGDLRREVYDESHIDFDLEEYYYEFGLVLDGLYYAQLVNNMPTAWLQHPGRSLGGKRKQVSHGEQLYDPEAEFNWFNKFISQLQFYIYDKWHNKFFLALRAAILKEDKISGMVTLVSELAEEDRDFLMSKKAPEAIQAERKEDLLDKIESMVLVEYQKPEFITAYIRPKGKRGRTRKSLPTYKADRGHGLS